MLQEFYEQDGVKVEILKAPSCAAVVSNSCQNICGCLGNAVAILKQFEERPLDDALKEYLTTKKIEFLHGTKEGKIKINTCGKGAIELILKRSDDQTIDPVFFKEQYLTIHQLIKKILADSDEYHIMYGSWDQELKRSDDHNGYVLTLHRGIPKGITIQ